MPVPDHVDDQAVLHRIDPVKDVDDFHPENVGRLIAGDARFEPYTPHGVQKLFAAADVEIGGTDVVVIGRLDIAGKSVANLLIQKARGGNTTITVYHSCTDGLAAKAHEADIVIAAAGVPELVTGNMLSEDVAVIDVGINRVDTDNGKGYELVDDVEFDSTREKANAITPVPGSIDPMVHTMLLWSTVRAAAEAEGADVDFP